MFDRYRKKKSSFLCFMAVFMSHCPLFRVSRRFTCLTGITKKSSFFTLYGRLHELFPLFWVPVLFTYFRVTTKNSSFAFYGRFNELLPIVLGFLGVLHVLEL